MRRLYESSMVSACYVLRPQRARHLRIRRRQVWDAQQAAREARAAAGEAAAGVMAGTVAEPAWDYSVVDGEPHAEETTPSASAPDGLATGYGSTPA
ncbi:hypothetical protein AB0K68_06120 [Streptomyces sp. NPDC050698]